MTKKKYKKEEWICEFVGEGEEELIDILKRQFLRYLNEQHAYPVITLKEDNKGTYFRNEYNRNEKKL
ncbi:hypothetical protein V7134_15855 [Priestia megaterium]|uniref:hypothetical protein n=1 Tax=Priestia megaterium TaxID=1404 RepID=UPI0030001904